LISKSVVILARDRVYGAQELHDLVADLGRGFVLYPVAHIVDFESSHETRKANSEFFYGG
jgi:hypothetical protein